MAINKNDKGLTLIELLITIAVIAIVAAISVPVITNVIDSARDNSAGSMEAQVNSFIDKYTESGEVSFDGTDEFTAWVDLDGDGVFSSPAEVIETFTVDTTQFTVEITGTNEAPTGATVTAAGANNAGGNNNAGGGGNVFVANYEFFNPMADVFRSYNDNGVGTLEILVPYSAGDTNAAYQAVADALVGATTAEITMNGSALYVRSISSYSFSDSGKGYGGFYILFSSNIPVEEDGNRHAAGSAVRLY